MKWLLIIWLAPFNAGSAYPDGSLAVAPFGSEVLCLQAIKVIKLNAKTINGVCVQAVLTL